MPGAGGWGDPLTRDLAAVAQDLRLGKITPEGALRDYGVVVRDGEIDLPATETERRSRTP